MLTEMYKESALAYAKEKGITPRELREGDVTLEARGSAMSDARECSSVNNIEVIYNHVVLVLKGVSLRSPAGGIVALLGGNGAGKTTTLKAISNLLRAERGEVTKGSITFDGQRIDALDALDGCQAWLHPGHGGTPLLRRTSPSRKTCDRCLYRADGRRPRRRRPRQGLRASPEAQGTA